MQPMGSIRRSAQPRIRYQQCPAKTWARPDGTVVPGRHVAEHCQIVGEVARELIARYPADLQESLFPNNAPFAAACHDIGKVSPCFFEKLRQACAPDSHNLPALPFNPRLERTWGGHAGVSQVSAAALGAPHWVPEVLGQHHGFTPPVTGKRAEAEIFGGTAWQEQRNKLVEDLKQCLGMDWPSLQTEQQARLVAGLTSVADWIGSGRLFEDPNEAWQPRIQQALDDAGFVPPSYDHDLDFERVFHFTPRAAQAELIDAVTGPGVYVLEAPMGLGKTEAALYAAYRLLQRGEACGIYFALPTQLTSNKIHQRFEAFLDTILAPDCQRRSALLLHASAWLVHSEMGEEGRPGGAWFNSAKRGLLAPFAVGTIDQALMAAMNVKHGFVRAFGLAGKVVILDEVHTYDAYTGTLLDALVKLLRGLGCTVIILSATLNQRRRSELMQGELQTDAYPLITAAPDNEPARELPVPAQGSAHANIRLQQDDRDAVQAALDRANDGQQVLWIENTVKEAQQRYLDIAARASELGIECGLLHSRFTRRDRQQIENHWVDLFGKPGFDTRTERGRILVGTQVLEQSLDIDADFLVSRFAPTDMLLQRLGRLWRHAATPRPSHAACEAWLLVPELDAAIEAPQSAFGPSAWVYDAYVLCRSLEVWQARTAVDLPQDIRGLIEATYVERQEADAMARWLHELEDGTRYRKGRKALQQLARIGLATDGKTLPESKAQTRYSETDSFDVLLLRDLQQLPAEESSRLVLLDETVVMLPWSRSQLGKRAWKKLTAHLMQHIVSVRPGEAPLSVPSSTLRKCGIGNCFYLGNPDWAEDESLLRIALVDEASALRGLYGAPVHDKHKLEYRDDLGYRVIKG